MTWLSLKLMHIDNSSTSENNLLGGMGKAKGDREGGWISAFLKV